SAYLPTRGLDGPLDGLAGCLRCPLIEVRRPDNVSTLAPTSPATSEGGGYLVKDFHLLFFQLSQERMFAVLLSFRDLAFKLTQTSVERLQGFLVVHRLVRGGRFECFGFTLIQIPRESRCRRRGGLGRCRP